MGDDVTMRAIHLVSPGPDPEAAVVYDDSPAPRPADGEVLIRVTASAVCRTDLQLATGDLPSHKLPVIPGHQVVGRVEALGAGVDDPPVGSRVGLVWQASACGKCGFCVTGRENLCTSATFTGWDRDGGYAELVTARADFTHPIPDLGERFPDGLAGDVAVAPLLCGGVIGYRSLRVAGIGPDSRGVRLGLFGFGASASLAIQLARHWESRCFVITRSAHEVERALSLGAEWAGKYGDPLPEPLDAAITFAPTGLVVAAALRSLDRGGTLAINAIHLDQIPALDYDDLWWERSIRSVSNVTRADVREFLSLVGPAGVRTEAETLPLSHAGSALRRLASGDVRGAFVLLPPD